ncbi:MAG: ABC transporter ATP-binding protein/permease [Candidatus Dormibacteraeota bacterium]|nr:ABC transporter ATP-binding protein/permease [Candidatus Dormibacteraeota bacterium]
MKLLRTSLRRHWRLLALGVLTILLANGLALLYPYYLGQAVDAITRGQEGRIPMLALAVIIAAGAAALSQFFRRLSFSALGYRVESEMRSRLFAHLLKLDQGFFQQIRTGDIMARTTNDMSAVQALITIGLSNLGNALVIFVAVVTLMLLIDWQLTVLSVCLFVVPHTVLIIVGPNTRRRSRRLQEQFAALTARAQENLSGIRVVKAYAQEDAERQAFRELNQDYMERSLGFARLYNALWPVFAIVDGVAAVVLLYVGGIHVVQGRITLGQFVQFMAYLLEMSGPVLGIGWVVNYLFQGAASLRRIEEIVERAPAIQTSAAPRQPTEARGEIQFDDVTFIHNGRPVLAGFSLLIPAGSTVGVVGTVGSGKTTLVSLLLRLYDPDRGRILFDGVDTRDLSLEWLRTQIRCVLQEPFLFSETLAWNISLGADNLESPSLRWAADISQLSADLDQFPDGLETIIGERGITLSGGQKQRTTIARALLTRPRVLVLDDAFSSVDTATEEAILEKLRAGRGDQTRLVIAHRVSTIKDSDLIVVLQEGQAVEQGTHGELLRRRGVYARLYGRQQLEEDLFRWHSSEGRTS